MSGPPVSSQGPQPSRPRESKRPAAFVVQRRLEMADARLPFVERGAAGPNDDEAGGKAAVLDGIRIRQHRDRINRVGRKGEADEAGRGIDQRARADLSARLAGTPAFDAHAARDHDDGGQQLKRRLQAVASAVLLDSLGGNRITAADRLGRQRRRRHHIDAGRHRNRQVHRDRRRLVRWNGRRDLGRLKPFE